MKLSRVLYPLVGLGILLAVTATGGCDPAPIDIRGTWVVQPVLMDSGWCRTSWTFSENGEWKALHVFSEDSGGINTLRIEQSFGLWLIEPGVEHRVSGREAGTWQLAMMVIGIERQRLKGFYVDKTWISFDATLDGWASPSSPRWPRSYALIRRTSQKTIELTIQTDRGTGTYRRLILKK
jgi:hypothetical protein